MLIPVFKMGTTHNYRLYIADTNLFQQKFHHINESLAAEGSCERIGCRFEYIFNSVGFTCSKTS